MTNPLDKIIGNGWSFPIEIDGRGGIKLSRGVNEIEEAMQLIIGTPVGQRFMRPLFGCRIHELLFAPINAITISTAQQYVEDALNFWEPRIDVEEVQVQPHPQKPSMLLISLRYRIKANHDVRALVYPFYTIPPE
jgi:phage baseplate assembly protein W